MFYKGLLRPLIFALSGRDAERAHEFVLDLLERTGQFGTSFSLLRSCLRVRDDRLQQKLFGLTFPNPVGLAAGFDKDGRCVEAIKALGFGSVTVGTVVPNPQPGNDRPRLFRLPEHHAIINRMGFNSGGVKAVTVNLAAMRNRGRVRIPVGVSLGKQKETPVDDLAAVRRDYLIVLGALREYVNFVEVNFSSPNTTGLRSLQTREGISRVAGPVKDLAGDIPVLLKVAPDLTDEELVIAVETCISLGLNGLIEDNTTMKRDGVESHPLAEQTGGLSGAPLKEGTRDRVRCAHREGGSKLPVIGVGGVATWLDTVALLRAGASAVQLYSGLIYEGPTIARDINRGLASHMKLKQVPNVTGIRSAHLVSLRSAGIA